MIDLLVFVLASDSLLHSSYILNKLRNLEDYDIKGVVDMLNVGAVIAAVSSPFSSCCIAAIWLYATPTAVVHVAYSRWCDYFHLWQVCPGMDYHRGDQHLKEYYLLSYCSRVAICMFTWSCTDQIMGSICWLLVISIRRPQTKSSLMIFVWSVLHVFWGYTDSSDILIDVLIGCMSSRCLIILIEGFCQNISLVKLFSSEGFDLTGFSNWTLSLDWDDWSI